MQPRVAIVTDDLLFLQQAKDAMGQLDLEPLVFPFDRLPPPSVQVVVTTPAERSRVRFDPQRVAASTHATSAARAALVLLNRPPRVEPVVIGIDPGPRPGVAVLWRGEVVSAFQVALEDVAPLVERVAGDRGPQECTVRLGDGSPLEGAQLANSLLRHGLRCEIVDERGTTPAPGEGELHHSLRDIAAAIAIARKPGETARPAALEPSEGEIERVQADSRRASGGRTTIPRSQASRVARGELALDEALRLHANGAVPNDDDGGSGGGRQE